MSKQLKRVRERERQQQQTVLLLYYFLFRSPFRHTTKRRRSDKNSKRKKREEEKENNEVNEIRNLCNAAFMTSLIASSGQSSKLKMVDQCRIALVLGGAV